MLAASFPINTVAKRKLFTLRQMASSSNTSGSDDCDVGEKPTLHIMDLPYWLPCASLRAACEPFGDVQSVIMMRDWRFHRFTGVAFVNFANMTAAAAALKHIKQKTGVFWGCKAAFSISTNDPTENTDPCKVFVGGLHCDLTTEEVLRARFRPYGFIYGVRIVRLTDTDRYGISRHVSVWNNSGTFATMSFQNPRAAARAIEAEDGSLLLGRFIHVQYATGRKKKTPYGISSRRRGAIAERSTIKGAPAAAGDEEIADSSPQEMQYSGDMDASYTSGYEEEGEDDGGYTDDETCSGEADGQGELLSETPSAAPPPYTAVAQPVVAPRPQLTQMVPPPPRRYIPYRPPIPYPAPAAAYGSHMRQFLQAQMQPPQMQYQWMPPGHMGFQANYTGQFAAAAARKQQQWRTHQLSPFANEFVPRGAFAV